MILHIVVTKLDGITCAGIPHLFAVKAKKQAVEKLSLMESVTETTFLEAQAGFIEERRGY